MKRRRTLLQRLASFARARSSVVALLLLFLCLAAMGSAQKPGKPFPVVCSNPTQADLDCGVALVVGKRGFYNPTIEEGCDTSAPMGCKFPATITAIETVPDADRPGRFLPLRDEQGRIVVSVFVERPLYKGGPFARDRVPFSNNCDGCFRTVQSPDIVGL